jgi:MOSC domain-containing protein YiiM
MTTARLLSIQVGLPASRDAGDKNWTSGIFKFPVQGRIWLGALNLAGDGQADLQNHGGEYRAVLAYSADRYPAWREELAWPDMPYGAFGENFTVTEFNEETVAIGDIFTVGEAMLQVTQPRLPCWKLARRWEMPDLPKRVEAKRAGGWYHRVLQEGYVEAGDTLTRIEHPAPHLTIAAAFGLIYGQFEDATLNAAFAEAEAMTPRYRQIFQERVKA